MINYMIQFANNFEADCRDGFVSNDRAYIEKAIEGVDLNDKMRDFSYPRAYLPDFMWVDMLAEFVRQDLDAETFLTQYIENMYNM